MDYEELKAKEAELALINEKSQLWEEAAVRCLDKIDWDIYDWLDEAETARYNEIQKKLGNL